ncbi:hypothetical protein DRI50_00125 [candidate division KSB1 bacterium]|jgi:predicted Fe-Mo cluster-binding NifX family protein|nr:MAG: hypothetical protein DRI50_00125 [candidate division KSB1 bacterium]
MKIAIPLWQNRVAPLMDCCSKLKVFELKEGRLKEINTVDMATLNLAERIKVLRQLNLDLVICNGISFFYRACLLVNTVKVISDVYGEEQLVLAKYLHEQNFKTK